MWVLQDDGELSAELKTYAKRFVKYLNDNFDGVENENDIEDYFHDGLNEWIRERELSSFADIDKFIAYVGFIEVFDWFKASELSNEFFMHKNQVRVWDFMYVMLEEAFYSSVKWVEQ